jgi:hypothetical protein
MSYLGRLIEQTGIDHMSNLPRADSASTIFEMKIQQIVPPPAMEPPPEGPGEMTIPPIKTSVPNNISRLASIEHIDWVERAVPAHVPVSQIAAPPRALEPAFPEIVIETPADKASGARLVVPASDSRDEPGQVRLEARQTVRKDTDQNLTDKTPVEIVHANALPARGPTLNWREPAPDRPNPTFFEIRDWVASASAVRDPVETAIARVEASHPAMQEPRSATREFQLAPRTKSELPHPPEAPPVELSIGTVQVVVEAQHPSVQPLQPQPAIARANPPPPSSSRLSRRYIHL